ncbi:MAG: NAD-dependent epimerase/dehydratase family protein [Rhodospirillales bacterium]|nr:NAD-dependent epimerase/dehydratase family protein [Rhodospirillales bacterium]MBO6787425.1 NAD-dependent epimerase/dehydratase family protein [Rhodospirillales bacterium]
MPVLVTGTAGFIGFHTVRALAARGERVIGVDNINDYYDPSLKRARLAELEKLDGFTFVEGDIADLDAMQAVAKAHPDITRIVNLAAQAGVRYSLENPFAYTRSNVEGHLVMLEMARHLKNCEHFVYASSSSVYGANTELPFSVDDRVDQPVSLYAATKRAGELMSHCYSRLYGIPATGLRFFTVYGPWGRPDMAAWIFTRKILAGEPIEVFNEGDMFRDFTFIDDIIQGVMAVLDHVPDADVPERVYNLGNHQAEKLTDFIAVLEDALGKKADVILKPMQPGDVKATFADIEASRRDLGFEPVTSIREGIPQFVEWYRRYHGNQSG